MHDVKFFKIKFFSKYQLQEILCFYTILKPVNFPAVLSSFLEAKYFAAVGRKGESFSLLSSVIGIGVNGRNVNLPSGFFFWSLGKREYSSVENSCYYK